jgi:2-polyprenyl-3-methyl-5-hydroxy-6-metoxy-1,4-benzoquinol methylase
MNGGYEEGYRSCPCFWGTEPGSFVRLFKDVIGDTNGLRVLDAGCGEGKNSVFLAEFGAIVDAVDISALAVENGKKQWPSVSGLNWRIGDIQHMELPSGYYDAVIGYGVLHCMPDEITLKSLLSRLQKATRPWGYNILCTFNSRSQDLSAHPNFHPTLFPHSYYLEAYSAWRIVAESDSDLVEEHPHNNIVHTHSMSRILAQRVDR